MGAAGGGGDLEGGGEMKKVLRVVWLFCSYVFLLQFRPENN